MSNETQSKCACVAQNGQAEEHWHQILIVKVEHHGSDSDYRYDVAQREAFGGAKIAIDGSTEGICYDLSEVTDQGVFHHVSFKTFKNENEEEETKVANRDLSDDGEEVAS